MKFTTKESKGVTVIELSGNVLGGPDASSLNDQLRALLGKKKTKVVVDLSGVQFINSSGLGMLIGGLTTMKHGGGDMKLARASEKIMHLLDMTKLSGVFDVHESVPSAIDAYS